jgi:AP-3 complex subunit delta-1
MSVFKKNLTDLIRGIRGCKDNTDSQYISQAIQEIKEEVRSTDWDVKAQAIQKLTFLHMIGYEMGWAAFFVVEVMSHQKFTTKRIAYLAAAQTYGPNSEVALLTTHLIRKDFSGTKTGRETVYDAGNALNCLSNICSPGLARDLAPDIISLLTSARPYIRRRAILSLYKIFIHFPEALKPAFNKLKDKLDDPDAGVVGAVVNVLCELARLNPRNYLPLAPILFKILMKPNPNNWILIKVIKIFSLLAPLEPRLARKLVDPLCNIINTTNSMFLLYECIKACITGLTEYKNVMRLCCAKLRTFIEHPDLNLKYLGLLAMSKIMDIFPKGMLEHRDLILSCLDDEDVSIRIRALDLLVGMVSENSIGFIISKLKEHLNTAEGQYQNVLLEKIVQICSQSKYKFVTDFEWYISTLMDITQVKGSKNGSVIRDQFLDISLRVKVVRLFLVKNMLILLKDSQIRTEKIEENGMCESLYAAAWIVGENSDLVTDPLEPLECILHPDTNRLPEHIQAIYMQCVFKLFLEH